MVESGIPVSVFCSTMSDQELDTQVSEIKAQMPHNRYRLVIGRLRLDLRPEGTVEQNEGSYAQSRCNWDFCSFDTVNLCCEKQLCKGTPLSCAC